MQKSMRVPTLDALLFVFKKLKVLSVHSKHLNCFIIIGTDRRLVSLTALCYNWFTISRRPPWSASTSFCVGGNSSCSTLSISCTEFDWTHTWLWITCSWQSQLQIPGKCANLATWQVGKRPFHDLHKLPLDSNQFGVSCRRLLTQKVSFKTSLFTQSTRAKFTDGSIAHLKAGGGAPNCQSY